MSPLYGNSEAITASDLTICGQSICILARTNNTPANHFDLNLRNESLLLHSPCLKWGQRAVMKAFNVQSVQLCPSPFMSLINATDWKAYCAPRQHVRRLTPSHPDITGLLDSITRAVIHVRLRVAYCCEWSGVCALYCKHTVRCFCIPVLTYCNKTQKPQCDPEGRRK